MSILVRFLLLMIYLISTLIIQVDRYRKIKQQRDRRFHDSHRWGYRNVQTPSLITKKNYVGQLGNDNSKNFIYEQLNPLSDKRRDLKHHDLSCVICLQDTNNPLLVNILDCCDYLVHITHLEKWVKDNNGCPACNKIRFTTSSISLKY